MCVIIFFCQCPGGSVKKKKKKKKKKKFRLAPPYSKSSSYATANGRQPDPRGYQITGNMIPLNRGDGMVICYLWGYQISSTGTAVDTLNLTSYYSMALQWKDIFTPLPTEFCSFPQRQRTWGAGGLEPPHFLMGGAEPTQNWRLSMGQMNNVLIKYTREL